MPHIPLIDAQNADGAVNELFDNWLKVNAGRNAVPPIIQSFAYRADVLTSMLSMTHPLHFSEGSLSRRVKEMIATFTSGLNGCPY